jgi:hypothetical protein
MSGPYAPSLRAALAGHEPARGKRYEPVLKARIIEFARSRRDQGGQVGSAPCQPHIVERARSYGVQVAPTHLLPASAQLWQGPPPVPHVALSLPTKQTSF